MKSSFAREGQSAPRHTSLRVWQALYEANVQGTANVKWEQLLLYLPSLLCPAAFLCYTQTGIHALIQQTKHAMAENAPPGSSKDAAADTSRGMPYYERLRRDLRDSLQKKRIVDNNLVGALREPGSAPSYLPLGAAQPGGTNPEA
jgi:hypothetical protein